MALVQGEDIDIGVEAGGFWQTLAEGARWVWDNVIAPAAQWVWENRERLMEEYGSVLTSTLRLSQVMLGPVPLYVIEEERLTLEGRATPYAIEDKDQLADHVYNEPKRVRLKAWIGSPTGGLGRGGLDLGGPEILHVALIKLQREKTPVTYISRMAVWPNMVVTRYEPVYTARHANAYLAEIVLEQVKLGTEPGEPQAPQPEQPQDQGNATERGAPPSEEDRSLLDRFIRAVGGLLGKAFGGRR